jgi:hypothetical protein
MNDLLKEALQLSAPTDPDPRDEDYRPEQRGQEKTMLSPALSETELARSKGVADEALKKSEALKPLK